MFDPTRPGPFYEDFSVGRHVAAAAVGHADRRRQRASYRAITGDQHVLAADVGAYPGGIGSRRRARQPGHRDAVLDRPDHDGDAPGDREPLLPFGPRAAARRARRHASTTTTVLGLKDSAPKGDQYRGKVWLGITSPVPATAPSSSTSGAPWSAGRTTEQPGHADDDPRAVRPHAARRARRAMFRRGTCRTLPASHWDVGDDTHRSAPRPHRSGRAVRPAHVQPGCRAPRPSP